MLNVSFIEKKRFFVSSFIALLHVSSRTLHETRPNTEFFLVRIFLYCMKSVQIPRFFWSVFSCPRTEYRDLRSKSPYSVRTQENTEQKKLRIWAFFTHCSLFSVLSHFVPMLWFTSMFYSIFKYLTRSISTNSKKTSGNGK